MFKKFSLKSPLSIILSASLLINGYFVIGFFLSDGGEDRLSQVEKSETGRSIYYRGPIEEITKEDFFNDPKKRRKYKSLLISNSYSLENNKLLNHAIILPIFDVRYISYRTEFAKAYGYSLDDQYIDDTMSEGLKAVEFVVKNEGKRVRCFMNLLVDKSLDIDLPDQEEFIMKSLGEGRIGMPNDVTKHMGKEEFNFILNVRSKNEAKYNTNILLGDGNRKGKSAGGVYFREYSSKYFTGVNYIKTNIGCNDLTRRILKTKNPSLWIKKKGGRNYSNYKNHLSQDQDMDFYKLRLPKKSINKILPIMKQTDGYLYNNNGLIKLTNN